MFKNIGEYNALSCYSVTKPCTGVCGNTVRVCGNRLSSETRRNIYTTIEQCELLLPLHPLEVTVCAPNDLDKLKVCVQNIVVFTGTYTQDTFVSLCCDTLNTHNLIKVLRFDYAF